MRHALAVLFLALFASLPLAAPASGSSPAGPQSGSALESTLPAVLETHREGCASCGKRIFFGKRCATCLVKERLPDKACSACGDDVLIGSLCAPCRVSALDARLQRECLDCDRTTRLGPRCVRCAAAHVTAGFGAMSARVQAFAAGLDDELGARLTTGLEQLGVRAEDARPLDSGAPSERPLTPAEARAQAEAEAIAAAEASWRKRALEFAQARVEAAGEGASELAQQSRSLAKRIAAPGSLGDRTAIAIGAALEVADTIETTKATVAAAGIRRALDVPVQSALGELTLGDLATAKLLDAAPELAGTDLAEDPAAVLAAVIVLDPLGFLMDLELVPTDTEPVSVMEALAARGSEHPERTVAAITLIEAVASLRRGENVTRSLRDLGRSLEVLAPAPTEAPAPDASTGTDD